MWNDALLNSPVTELVTWHLQLFGNVSEPEVFSNRYVYKIAQKEVTSLAKVFGSLEQAKDELGIEEYSFSQSTLEQVGRNVVVAGED